MSPSESRQKGDLKWLHEWGGQAHWDHGNGRNFINAVKAKKAKRYYTTSQNKIQMLKAMNVGKGKNGPPNSRRSYSKQGYYNSEKEAEESDLIIEWKMTISEKKNSECVVA